MPRAAAGVKTARRFETRPRRAPNIQGREARDGQAFNMARPVLADSATHGPENHSLGHGAARAVVSGDDTCRRSAYRRRCRAFSFGAGADFRDCFAAVDRRSFMAGPCQQAGAKVAAVGAAGSQHHAPRLDLGSLWGRVWRVPDWADFDAALVGR